MTERQTEKKSDEQYPLLKVDSGPGNITVRQQPSNNTFAPTWTVTCTPKETWFDRWPEFVSICWMTLILLGMSFLVFYALGMGAYGRPALTMLRCNDSKPGTTVFFHHIIKRGSYLPFLPYSQFLSKMAVKYPFLRFNFFFLFGDPQKCPYHGTKSAKLFNGFLTYQLKEEYEESSNKEIQQFQNNHPNVNITVMSLNRFMAMTPLRYKWRGVPLNYLTFYARVFSVWQNGGIAMDLAAFKTQFCENIHFDQRINAILTNHNQGLPISDYNTLLSVIDREEESTFNYIKNQIINETVSIFNAMFSFPQLSTENSLQTDVHSLNIPTNGERRFKRDIMNEGEVKDILQPNTSTTQTLHVEAFDVIDNVSIANIKLEKNYTSEGEIKSADVNYTSKQDNDTAKHNVNLKQEPYKNFTVKMNKTEVNFEIPQIVLFYDFSVMSENSGSPLSNMVQDLKYSEFCNKTKVNKVASRLAINSDGTFVAATGKVHPFLGILLSSNIHKLRPDFALLDVLLYQCSGMKRDDDACNIYIL